MLQSILVCYFAPKLQFLILDGNAVYHVGASLKDLGKKPVVSEAEPWFAFTKMEKESVENILKAIGR